MNLKVNNVKDSGMNAQVEAFEQRRITETEVMSQRRTFQEQDREQ